MRKAEQLQKKMRAMNEALLLGSLRQHKLTEAAEELNAELQAEIRERKGAEEKVRASEVRYRRLFETAHDGILLLDPETGRITEANPLMTKLLGYSHKRLVGKRLFEIGLLKNQFMSRDLLWRLKRKREVHYENVSLKTRPGHHHDVEVVAGRYLENGRTVIQCNVRDVTERKEAEAARRRVKVMTTANRELSLEISRRQLVEESLKESERHQSQLLEDSRQMQEQLRNLSRQVLRAQEEERKTISRELHDVIAQTLAGINIRLANLKKEAGSSTKGFDRNIISTQRLVEKSVDMVHQFARELRPAVLDDLGLIPALHTFMKHFTARTGVRTRLTAYAEVEKLDMAERTILYRVAQEALTNVARHAHASEVEVQIKELASGICMKVNDDGKSFQVERVLNGTGRNRLGLLGMRERLEMIGGNFDIESAPGKGTSVIACIPHRKGGVVRGKA